jgi:beta-glucosidase/6-phospho-beta-glucosidase/beta-galactosidase
MKGFPEGFLFGTATSAHQIEGSNTNSDWWEWEQSPGTPCVEPSGDACDFYHRYREDIALMAGLGFNAFRFSIECFGPEGPRGPHVQWGKGHPQETNDITQLGQENYPAALGRTIRRAWQSTGGTPILVTENGIATEDDARRVRYIDARSPRSGRLP